jgi:hypothetical protein
LRNHLLGFRTNHGANALRTNLHDAPGFLRRGYHRQTIRRGMRHWLFAINILARANRVHHHLLVPVIRHGRDQAVDLFVVEQFLVTPSRRNFLSDNFLRQEVPPIVQIASCHAFDARQLHRSR